MNQGQGLHSHFIKDLYVVCLYKAHADIRWAFTGLLVLWYLGSFKNTVLVFNIKTWPVSQWMENQGWH